MPAAVHPAHGNRNCSIGDREDIFFKLVKSITCTSTVPPTSCTRVPRLLYSTATFATNASLSALAKLLRHNSVPAARNPRRKPSIFYSFLFSNFRVAFFTTPLFSHRSALPPGISRPGCSTVHQSPVTNHKSRFFMGLPPLAFSCLSFSRSLPLFSIACSLFAQNRGV
jgi:hypothetical protein